MMQNDDVGAPAGFWIRFLAGLLDSIPVIGIQFGLMMIGAPMYLPLLFALFYYIYFPTSDMMGTPAKALIGLKITDDHGNKISIGTSILRYIGYMISGFILLIGLIMVGFTENKRGLHDMIASTRVTYK
jgi:uncharacterized RDD family membrane protein YckC